MGGNSPLGRGGEDRAAAYLRRRLYRVVERNYTTRFGEIDLIVKNARYVVFAEVKLRKDDGFATAREYVTRSKQEKILKTAGLWLSQNDCELQPRFDVIEVYAPRGMDGPVSVVHLEDAFM